MKDGRSRRRSPTSEDGGSTSGRPPTQAWEAPSKQERRVPPCAAGRGCTLKHTNKQTNKHKTMIEQSEDEDV